MSGATTLERSVGLAIFASRLLIAITGGLSLATVLAVSAMAESLPGFPSSPHAPEDAPNILLIMTDDVGFAVSTAFGEVFRPQPLTRSPKAGCVTTTSARPLYARRTGQPC